MLLLIQLSFSANRDLFMYDEDGVIFMKAPEKASNSKLGLFCQTDWMRVPKNVVMT